MIKLVVVTAIEVAVTLICIDGLGMGEGPAYCFAFAALFIVLAVAVYYDDSLIPKVKQNQEPQEDVWDSPSHPYCPYCLSGFVFISENGVGHCNDCDSYWTVEEV